MSWAPDNIKVIAELQADFVRRWRPANHQDAIRFEQELAQLIHMIYREACQPMIKQMAEILNRQPPPSIIKENK